MKLLIIALTTLTLVGCFSYSSSKTVWDAQGCAYTINLNTTGGSQPKSADDWNGGKILTQGVPSLSRSKTDDKPTCGKM